jgi:hypothetical protein
MLLRAEERVVICDKSNVFLANNLDIWLVAAVRSFVIITKGHIISECPTCPPQPTQCSVQAFHATTNYAVGPSNGGTSNGGAIQPELI